MAKLVGLFTTAGSMLLVHRNTLLTLIAGMRLLICNAAVDSPKFKVVNIDESSAQLSDLYVIAAKKLLGNTAYVATNDEKAFLLKANYSTRAEIGSESATLRVHAS